MRMGRIGIITRGVVFAIIGIYLVAAAFHANPHHQTGTDGALLGLARQPFGLALLAGAGIGLIIFGVFSIMCARWARMRWRVYATFEFTFIIHRVRLGS